MFTKAYAFHCPHILQICRNFAMNHDDTFKIFNNITILAG